MNIRKTAAQFFQNVADYLAPRAAWERQRVVHHELYRRLQGNFTGREWTREEAYQHNVDYFRQSLKNFQDNVAKIKPVRDNNLT